MGKRVKQTSKFSTFIRKFVILVIAIVILVGIVTIVLKTFIYPSKYIDIINENAQTDGLDPYLVLAIIKTESGFDADAVSTKEAKGLMQVKEATAYEFRSKDSDGNLNLFNPDTNIKIGMNYLSYLIEKYDGNYYLAICAYNAGLGNVDNWIKDNVITSDLDEYKNVDLPFAETEKYLNKVMSNYMMYKLLYI